MTQIINIHIAKIAKAKIATIDNNIFELLSTDTIAFVLYNTAT